MAKKWKPSKNQKAALQTAIDNPALASTWTGVATAAGLSPETIKKWRQSPEFCEWWTHSLLEAAREFARGPAMLELMGILGDDDASDAVKVRAAQALFKQVETVGVSASEATAEILTVAYGPRSEHLDKLKERAKVIELGPAPEDEEQAAVAQQIGAVELTRRPDENVGPLKPPKVVGFRGRDPEAPPAPAGQPPAPESVVTVRKIVDLAIAGAPRSGKSTMAEGLEGVRHGDDVKDLDWSEASEAVSHWFDDPDVRVIEGVVVPRALRKWLNRNPEGRPCNEIRYLERPIVELDAAQRRMVKGCKTVFEAIERELEKRGVKIVRYPEPVSRG